MRCCATLNAIPLNSRNLLGVPQGSILGPILNVLYTAELRTKSRDYPALAVQRFTEVCVTAISDWMSSCRLKLSPTKNGGLILYMFCRCSNMAVKEAEENDLMDDRDDDNADAESTGGGTADRKSKLSVDSVTGRPHHKCSIKPTVDVVAFSRFL